MGSAAARWRELQEGRGIPPEILAAAPVSPWGFDPADFRAPATPADTPSRAAGLALLDVPGSVLDVGCGGGDAGFALAARLTTLTGNDVQPDMLEVFAADARARGIEHRTVVGRWPDVGVDVHDVVVSNLVLHNVVELAPFVTALTAAARRGVVVEMLAQHPMAWLDPLWERFHYLRRPEPATVDDAVAVLREVGIEPTVVHWERPEQPKQDETVVARRLCLPPDRVPEVAVALAEVVRPRLMATLSWAPGQARDQHL